MLYLKNENYRDADLTFYLQVYKDVPRALWCLDNLRANFPNARVIVVSDGDTDVTWKDFALYNIELIHGGRLYSLECGGMMLQRMIELYLKKPTEYLFKIDTDTGIHRRFEWLPVFKRGGLFGQLQHDNYLCSIQGGFIGLDYHSVLDIYSSGALMSASLKDYKSTYALSPFIQSFCEKTKMVTEDWQLGYVCSVLGIPIVGFDEVRCWWKNYEPNPNLRYAVTHPCKDFKL